MICEEPIGSTHGARQHSADEQASPTVEIFLGTPEGYGTADLPSLVLIVR